MEFQMELEDPRRLKDFERKADEKMRNPAKWYFAAEAGNGENTKINEKALAKYRIKPRILRDVSLVNTETSLLGSRISYPIAAAPTGLHHLVHPSAEIAVAKACAKGDLLMAQSFVSSLSMEEITQAVPSSAKWLQIYICNDRNITREAVKRAEKCGYSAIILTADSPVPGIWKAYMPENFYHLAGNRCGNKLPKPIRHLLDPSVTYEGIEWLKSITQLPIVVKGVLRGEDAIEAVKHGASAIIVSNHGARMIDGVCATIDVLEEVVHAVEGYDVEVYMDGGIRTGSDVFRALALGAKAVFVGRPVVWGLSVAGEDGVSSVLQILKDEFRTTMCLAGTATLGEITKEMIVKEDHFSRL